MVANICQTFWCYTNFKFLQSSFNLISLNFLHYVKHIKWAGRVLHMHLAHALLTLYLYQHAIPAFVCVFKLILCEIFPPNAHNVINCRRPLTLSPTIAPHHADWSSPNPDLLSSQLNADLTTMSLYHYITIYITIYHPTQICCQANLTLI